MRQATDITGSPVTVGDHEVYPLRVRHLAEFEQWAREQLMGGARRMRQAMVGSDGPEEAQAFWAAVLAEARGIKIDRPSGLAELMTVTGQYWVLWQSLRQGKVYRQHTYTEIMDAFDLGTCAELVEVILEISGWSKKTKAKEAGDDSENPTQPAS